MTIEALTLRLTNAHANLVGLRAGVEAGVPWPRSEHFGAEPEASWMPPELLAHVAEMLPYWLGQIERILEGAMEPVSFGRVQSDAARIDAIGRDRDAPIGELYARIERGVAEVAARLRMLDDDAADKLGTHPTLGQMSVEAVVERMLAHHLEEHVSQLDLILAGDSGAR